MLAVYSKHIPNIQAQVWLSNKRWKKIWHANASNKNEEVWLYEHQAKSTSERCITRDRQVRFIMIKVSIYQEHLSVKEEIVTCQNGNLNSTKVTFLFCYCFST